MVSEKQREEKKSRNTVWGGSPVFHVSPHVASRYGVCDQKTSKLLVSLGEEFTPGDMGVNGVY
jgi:hypothetical protein